MYINIKYYITIVFILMLINFFGATSIPNVILLGLLIPFAIIEFKHRSIFKWYIVATFIGLLLSMISCYVFRKQSIPDTFKSSAYIMYLMFYFALKNFKLSLSSMEKILHAIIILFCLSYIVQFIVFPTVIFKGVEVKLDSTSVDLRFRLYAQGLSSLGIFFGINKFISTKNWKYLITAILCFIVILLMAFRTFLILIVVFSIFTIIRIKGKKIKSTLIALVSISILFITLTQIPVINEKLTFMMDRNKDQNFSNPQYIRILSFNYYTQRHFKNGIEYFFGSGMPAEKSRYGLYIQSLVDKGFYYQDLGLIGLSWIIGIPAVLVMIAYSIKAFRIKVNKNNYYLGIWFVYLVLASLTSMEFFRNGMFVIHAYVFVMLEKAQHQMEYSEKKVEVMKLNVEELSG